MKIKKTVSDKVIAANRVNAHASRGPGDCTKVRHNAVKHGFRAKQVFFNDGDEEKQYSALLEDLGEYYQPEGPVEFMLVEEIARCSWKLKVFDDWEMEEIANRRKAAKAILRAVADNYDEEQLPLFTGGDGSDSAAQLGWDCQELVVRTGSRNFEKEEADKGEKGGHVQIEARLNTSMDSILRYGAAAKRDLYRAIQTLRDLQQQRRAGSTRRYHYALSRIATQTNARNGGRRRPPQPQKRGRASRIRRLIRSTLA